ncbi:MAG TPA: tyrosine-type recombinase/integrase [Alphaproteobacteria bacterium]|nr:tyrosine-type recombinase/integrase [Alphaproteobacteria bacterium]
MLSPTTEPQPSLARAGEQFLLHCRLARNLSGHTLRAYGSDLREFCRFAGSDTEIAACDRACLRAYLRHLFEVRRLKEASVKRRMACLKAMYRWLEREGTLAVNPFHRLELNIRLPKRLPRSLTRGELQALLGAAHRALGLGSGPAALERMTRRIGRRRFNDLTALVALELLFATGMRVGELVSITRERLDLEEGVVAILGKGDRERRVFVAEPALQKLLAAYLAARARLGPAAAAAGKQPLLVNSQGNAASTQLIRKLIAALAARAGLARRVTPHMLRHSAATHLLEAGVDIRHVQRLLGHHSIATTERYTQVSDGSLKSAITAAHARERVWGKEGERR